MTAEYFETCSKKSWSRHGAPTRAGAATFSATAQRNNKSSDENEIF